MRRAAVLALLLVVPALAGCLGDGRDGTMPLVLDDVPVRVEDPGGHVAGGEVVLEASPVRDGLTYAWTLGGRTYAGPVLRVTLEAGSYEAVLTVAGEDGAVHTEIHAFEVAPATDDPDGTDQGDAAGGSGTGDGDGGDGGDADAGEPCGFGTAAIDVEGSGFEFTFRFPWPCQPDSWEWDLGDGTRSREGSVTHQYGRDGERTVTLTILHDGRTHTRTAEVTVWDVPLRILPTVEGDAVAYALTWGRDVASVQWDLGNGETASEPEPTTTYPHAGPWVVTATATDADGGTAAARRVVALDAYPLRVEADLVQDTADLSFHWGWTAEAAKWSLPPDCSFVDATGAGDDAPTVRCGRPGVHTIRLDVEGGGRTATATIDLEVLEVPLRIHVEPGSDPDLMVFSPSWHGPLTDFLWDLGDGTTSTQETVAHQYGAYGTFPVTLTATGGGEQMATETEVVVTDVPLRVSVVGSEGRWSFDLDWVDDPDGIVWDLGDGTTVHDEAAVVHDYAYKGTYDVTLTATAGAHTKTWSGEVEATKGTQPIWGDPLEASVRPGVQMHSKGLQCTASFLFHEDWSRYFLATAAHCVGEAGGTGGQQFSEDCGENEAFPLGTEVTFKDWRTGDDALAGRLAYSSWKTMADEGVDDPDDCVGNDFALVEIGRDDLGKVHPAVLHFGGPVGAGVEGARERDSSVRAYGASSTRNPDGDVGQRHAVNARGGEYDSHDGWQHSVRLDAPLVQGDSGGPLLTQPGDAIGVLSTVGALGTNQYTDLARAVAWMEAHTDLDVDLVTWGNWNGATPPFGTVDDAPL